VKEARRRLKALESCRARRISGIVPFEVKIGFSVNDRRFMNLPPSPLGLRPILAAVATALLCTTAPVSASVSGAACPADIQGDSCVANDLQPTGTEVISGPTACTEGETISATVRVHFQNGGGANARYSVGFFVGEGGEPAVGGASCTFDSLQPIGTPPNPLGGPYAELNGDACGDIDKAQPTYKDLVLVDLLCQDKDGDGNVDVSYVLSWVNNGNQANCSNPLDPAQFLPNPPKCRSDLSYDLPIDVEQPPSIEVSKTAIPNRLYEPGGTVNYQVTIANTSPSVSDPVTIDTIIDQIDGQPPQDISGQTDCTLPFTLAPGQVETCAFVGNVKGRAGDTVTDTVTVRGTDDEGEPVEDSADATVEIILLGTPAPPGELRVLKFALPGELDEPGGMVNYAVLVANLSQTGVNLTALDDDLYGDLDGQGSCSVPQFIGGANPLYYCSFSAPVSGQPGDVVTDTITAQGTDVSSEGNPVIAQDTASVTIVDVPSAIEVSKIAYPDTVQAPGGNVTFELQVQNLSVTDSVTINTLLDSELGVPNGNCSAGFTLAPGESYQCTYSGRVSGAPGDTVTNIVTAVGRDDDGGLVFGLSAASVEVIGTGPAPSSIEVVKTANPVTVREPGGDVTFDITIYNTSSVDVVRLFELNDSVYGNLLAQNLCPPPLPLFPGRDPYRCSFTAEVSGSGGYEERNTVTARGTDDDNVAVEASDEASVTVLDRPPSIAITKAAQPDQVFASGERVTFTVVVANTSASDTVTIDALVDSVYGDLDGQGDCAVPQALAAQATYSCRFEALVTGTAGETHLNQVTASGTSDDGDPVAAAAVATVDLLDDPPAVYVDVPIFGKLGLALLALLLGWIGYARLRAGTL
jgi:hypothetical protein